MIILEKKEFEVEEQIQIKENESIIYEFTMQITPDEMTKINKILFTDNIDSQKQVVKLKAEGKIEEAEKLEEEIGNKILQNNEELYKIIYKEHYNKVKELCNEYQLDKLNYNIVSFFIKAFVKSKTEPLSSTIIDLQRIMKK